MRTRRTMMGGALLIATLVQAQSTEQFTIWGDNAMSDGDHYGASRFYAQALEKEPGKLDLQWKCAEAYRLSNQYPEAAALYEKVVHKDIRHTHPEALRWMAEMYMSAGDYTNAEKTWRKVRMQAKDTASFDAKRAVNALRGCAMANAMMASPEVVAIEHPQEPLNTYDSEFGAREDSSTLYFSSLRGELNEEGELQDTATYHVRIFSATRQNDAWLPQGPLPPNVNGTGDNANSAWTPDHKWFYFTRCDAQGHCSIHISSWVNGVLGEAQFVPGLSEDGNATQPMVTKPSTLNRMYFASDRPKGMGGMDIWVCEVNGTRIMNPRPLGAPVNTPGNETCPFYDVTQHKLYFSSDFHAGLGGYDNFMCVEDNGRYSTPVNFGYPLNGPANDLYPTFDMTSMSGWFTSNRVGSLAKKGETCCNDLYRYSYPHTLAPLPEVLVDPASAVVDPVQKHLTSLREKLPIRLYFHNDEPDPRSWSTSTARSYEKTYESYKSLVPQYRKAWKDDPSGGKAIDDFFHDHVDQGYAQLNEFTRLLRKSLDRGESVDLLVRGFASPLAKSDYNKNLSLRRISTLENFFRTTSHGALLRYMDGTAKNGARLTLREAPFGEDNSTNGVSDALSDLQGSVYSVGASLERRIEIEDAVSASGATANSDGVKDGTVQDLGHIIMGQQREVTFTVPNNGKTPLSLTTSKADCGCTTVRLPGEPIPPGGSRPVLITFNGHAGIGPLEREVTITTDGEPATLRLTITGTVEAAP